MSVHHQVDHFRSLGHHRKSWGQYAFQIYILMQSVGPQAAHHHIDFYGSCTHYVWVEGKVQVISDNHFVETCTPIGSSRKQGDA